MQKLFAPFFFFLFPFFITAQDYTLTVNNGTGSGSYFYGDTIHVFSDNAPENGVFTEWTGSGIPYLSIANEWHTTFVLSAESGIDDIVVNANFDQLPVSAIQVTEMITLFGEDKGSFIENVPKEVHYIIPENPKGIVFHFHGTGGHGSSMFSKYEIFTLIKDLYYAGYGSVSTDANEQTIGDQDGDGKIRWLATQASQQNFDNNIDLYNIRALRDTFIARYELLAGFPFFSYGVSNGANFSDLAAAAIQFRASAHNTAHGSPSLYRLRNDVTPVIWLQNVNDHNAFANPTITLANYQALLDRGICSELHWLARSPLYEKRFMRSRNDIDEQLSFRIFNHFLDSPGLVDGNNFIAVNDIASEVPANFLNPLDLTSAQKNDVVSQLKVINADHTGHGDFNKTIIQFFENTCQTTAVKPLIEKEAHISVFPNPTRGIIYFKSENAGLHLVSIFNMQGQLVLEKTYLNAMEIFRIDLSNLFNGVFILKIKNEGNIAEKKVILFKNK